MAEAKGKGSSLPPTTTPIYEIDTTEVEHIRIDGEYYPLESVARMSVTMQTRLKRQSKRLAELFSQDGEPTDEEIDEIESLIGEQFNAIAPTVPDDVAARLGDWNKMRVVNAFFRAERGSMPGDTADPRSANGESQSPDSSGSMEDGRATG